jgi:hypothetical protein
LAFHVHISDADRAYLDNLPLSDRAKERVEDFIDYAIANIDDASRADPANRVAPGHACFTRRLLLWDFWGDRRCHVIDFVVDDANSPFGVLLVVFVEHS